MDLKTLKKSIREMRRKIRRLKDKEFLYDELLERVSMMYTRYSKFLILSGEGISREISPDIEFMYKWHGIWDVKSFPPLYITGTLYNNITNLRKNDVYKIGIFRENVKITDPKLWAREQGVDAFMSPRSEIDGFMLAAITLEFGSDAIYVPFRVKKIFRLRAENFSIPAKRYLGRTYEDINYREVVLDECANIIRKALR